jgi:hypothetical protein
MGAWPSGASHSPAQEQPQEREHSDAAGGARDRLPAARGTIGAAAIVTRMGGDDLCGSGRGSD